MKQVIENIRNKPYEQKTRIIWICAAIGIAILLTVWLIVGNGHSQTGNNNFFQTFNQGFDEGKNTLPNLTQ